ncbi:hypothetical protein PUN28_020027 [Cardiocondyla obscurior]|uniref:Uncharacterized protein n=1 Tax=Cardiocondyla obscurior TaxID=286306 RepID=A0AAW2E7B5_9HYME
MVLPCVVAETCIKLLQNKEEIRILRRRPGHVLLWNAITGEFEQLEALKSNNSAFCSVDTIYDLRGRTLVVATDSMHPYIIPDVKKNEVTGIIGDAWTILEQALKFKTINQKTRRSIIATLMNGDIHTLLIATAMYMYSTSYYSYSVPFTTTSYALFVQSEGMIDIKWYYVNTFSHGLWLALFASIICIACSVVTVYRIKKFIHVNYEECDDELSSLSFNLLHVLGFQGFQKIPRSLSLRLIILSSLVMGMLMTCGFSSTLTSCLANKGNSVSLTNLEDVMMKRTHSLCIRNDSTAYVHFTVDKLPDSDLQTHWKELLNSDCPDMRDREALPSKLCRPGFAYLEAPAIFLPIYHKVQHECDIVQLPENYWSLKLTFLHARAARHRKLIDRYLMRMRSAGILNYLEKKWISQPIYRTSNYHQSNSFHPVEYKHIRLTNLYFFAMIIISTFICILENIWYKFQYVREGKKRHSILLGIHNNNSNNNFNTSKTSYKARLRYTWQRKLNLILLTEKRKNPLFVQKVTVRINRW